MRLKFLSFKNELKHIKITNQEKYERHFKYLKNINLPLPPLKIVSVIENLENKIEKLKSDLNALSSKNQEI